MNTIIYGDIEYQLTDTEKEIYENQHLYDIDTILKLPMYRNLYRNNKIIECRDDLDKLTLDDAYKMGLNISNVDKAIYYIRKALKIIFITAVFGSLFYFSYDYVTKQNTKLDTLFNKG